MAAEVGGGAVKLSDDLPTHLTEEKPVRQAREQETQDPSRDAGGERPALFHAIGEELRQAGCIGSWQGIKDGALYRLGLTPEAASLEALVEGLSRHCRALRDGGQFEARVVDGDFQVRYAPEKLDLPNGCSGRRRGVLCRQRVCGSQGED